MTTRSPWITSSATVLALHLAVLAALLADSGATVQASLRDEDGRAMGLGVLMGTLEAPQDRVQPARAEPRPQEQPDTVAQATPPPTPPAPNAVTDNQLAALQPATAAEASLPTASAAVASTSNSTAAATAPAAAGGLEPGAATSYFGKLKAWLNHHKKYPVAAKKEKQQGTVTVTFSIDRGGRLQTARVVQSSGQPLLDKAALDLLRAASPMPRIPDSINQDSLVITMPIEYSLITR